LLLSSIQTMRGFHEFRGLLTIGYRFSFWREQLN
jgi:hypothetical protein